MRKGTKIFSSDDASFRIFDKRNDVFDFGAHRNLFSYLLQGIGYVLSAIINDTVSIMDVFNQFVRESAPAQAYDIDSAISNRFASRYNIRWDVFAKPASALYHYVSAYPGFLRVYHGLRVRLP